MEGLTLEQSAAIKPVNFFQDGSRYRPKQKKIEVFFIPPYSPELNAQEYLNQDIKTNVIGKKSPADKTEMKSNVSEFMNRRKKNRMQECRYRSIFMQAMYGMQRRENISLNLVND